MAQIFDLKKQRDHLAAKKGFHSWSLRFSDQFDENTRPKDLSDGTLAELIKNGEDASMPLYELIMGVLGMGLGPRFYYLDTVDKMAVMDIALFLLDQLRFEAMHRLGWVEDLATAHVPLIALVRDFEKTYSGSRHRAPVLSPGHLLFDEYTRTFEGDRSPFIRRLIPQAIEEFCKDYEQPE